jgi:hypothetical protein
MCTTRSSTNRPPTWSHDTPFALALGPFSSGGRFVSHVSIVPVGYSLMRESRHLPRYMPQTRLFPDLVFWPSISILLSNEGMRASSLPSRNAGSSWLPYTVARLVTKAASTSETPEPTQTPSGSQIPAAGAS